MESPPCPLLDCHIHYPNSGLMNELIKLCEAVEINRLNVVCTPHQKRLSLLPEAFHLKANYPEKVYVFGGLDISTLFVEPDQAGLRFAEYAEKLVKLGCDGIKMIEGKPMIRKMLPVLPFDSEVMDPYWAKLSEEQIPLLFHVNDPQEFWIKDRVPDWAEEQGWYYGDGSNVHYETQYTEVLNVMERYPELKVIFAHFFFLSAQLPRLAEYLDHYPNMHIDVTPGIEMYFNFSARPEESRRFFETYQDRIMFGTDVGAKALLDTPELGIDDEESRERIYMVRRFLENDEPFGLSNASGFLFGESESELVPLSLSHGVLEKIYHLNFERFVGGDPRPLDMIAIADECDRLAEAVEFMGAVQPDLAGDSSVAKKMADYFRAKTNS